MNRILYVSLLVSFLGLTFTGLPLKYSSQRWAQVFVKAWEDSNIRACGISSSESRGFRCWPSHLASGPERRRRRRVKWRVCSSDQTRRSRPCVTRRTCLAWPAGSSGSGPNLPSNAGPIGRNGITGWRLCVRAGGYVRFDDVVSQLFCRVISGETLNVARVIHVELALLATSFLFVFHFYHTHFRPEKFPMDLSAVTGLVNEAHLRENRPQYVARLEEIRT